MSPRSSQLDPPLRCAALAALLPGWRAMPPPRRAEMIRAAEALHDTLDPDGAFPVDYIAFRLTGYRRDHGDPALLVGDAVRHDLRWIIDTLGKSTPLPIGEDDARPVDDWAMRLDVNPRTLRRWRDDGLRWRWLKPAGGGRRVIGHTAAAVEHFRATHPERFEFAQKFSQIDAATHAQLLDDARELGAASPGISLSTAAQRLAETAGRAHETVRLLLEKHDREHPQRAIFAPRRGPLDRTERRRLRRAHRAGTPLSQLALEHGKSVGTIHRALLVRRAAVVRRVPLSFVDSPLFARAEADEVFLRPVAEGDAEPPAPSRQATAPPALGALPPALRGLFDHRPPTPDAMRSRFLRYNYLKAKAHRLRAALPPPRKLRAADLNTIEDAVRDASRTHRQLIRANLPETLSVVGRQLTGDSSPQPAALLRLLIAAWPALCESIESFNASGNVSFYRYLRNRLLQRFATLDAAAPHLATKRESADALAETLLGLARNAGLLVDDE